MFKCNTCEELKTQLEYLRKQNQDLLDRLMAFNQNAFNQYNSSKQPNAPLYPSAINEKGEEIVYSDKPEQQAEDVWKILSGEPITVDEFPEEAAARAQNERS